MDNLVEQEQKEEYLIFPDKEDRHQIVEIGRKIDEYVHDRGIQDIIFVDRSARPGYITVLENWRRMYPTETPPNIFFMSPKGFRSLEEIENGSRVHIKDNVNASNKDDLPESRMNIRSRSEVKADLLKTYPILFGNIGRHVLLFDTCIHSGDSIKPILEFLTELGLDVRVGIVSSEKIYTNIYVDLKINDGTLSGGCNPFDKDRLVQKSYESVHGLKNEKASQILKSNQIRQEIRHAVSDYYEQR